MFEQIEEVRKVDVSPNDTVVVRVTGHLSQEACARLTDILKAVFPNNKCVVLDTNMSIDVFTLTTEAKEA